MYDYFFHCFTSLRLTYQVRLEKYENLTYTEKQIKEAKDDRAGLNKFKEAIETRRKEIKKLCLQPYNEFEAKVKELTGLIDKPINAIDTQLKNFEDLRITAKNSDIEDFYKLSIGDLKDLLPLEKIINPKWTNASYKMSNIQKEMIDTIGKVNGDLKIIEDLKLESDIELQVRDKYLQTLDFGAAMAEKNRLETLRAYFKERKASQDIQTLQEEVEPAPTSEETTTELENNQAEQPLEMVEIKFWAKGTKEQLIELYGKV